MRMRQGRWASDHEETLHRSASGYLSQSGPGTVSAARQLFHRRAAALATRQLSSGRISSQSLAMCLLHGNVPARIGPLTQEKIGCR